MAYHLKALIAEHEVLTGLAMRLPGARVAALDGALGILPLTDELLKGLPAGGRKPFASLDVSPAVGDAARAASAKGPVAFVMASYDTGKDYQAAAVWTGGKVALGPLIDETAWDPREPAALRERPVNSALRLLGVDAGEFDDEWDAVGMARHRDTADWK